MSDHALKVQPPYFDALADGLKTFDVRHNDRGFQRGDTVLFEEYDPALDHEPCVLPGCTGKGYTGRTMRATITYVYAGDPRFGGIHGGLEPGFVVLALARLDDPATGGE